MLCYLFVAGVTVCRVYLGRHSIDQVIFGLELGLLSTHFNMNYLKPILFDPVFYPGPEDSSATIVARSRKAFLVCALVYVAIVVKMVLLYDYVDSNNVIPQQWFDVIKQTCPVFKKSGLFHHFSIVYTGVVAFVPGMYFFNYVKHSW